MNLADAKPTLADFDRSGWEQVAERAEVRVCDRYHYLFSGKARELATDTGASSALILLAVVTSFHMNLQETQQPFRPILITPTGRSAVPDDLTREHLEVLESLTLKITDPELLSRVLDVLWIRQRKYQMAQQAVEAYLGSASNLLAQHPVPAAERLERALQLSATLGKQGDLFAKVSRYAEDTLRSLSPDDSPYLPHRIMDLLLRFGIGNAAVWVADAEARAAQAERQRDLYWARAFWELKAVWDHRLGDNEAEERSRIAIAETYVQEVEAEASSDNPSFFSAALSLQQAIEAYRLIPNTAKRQRELHRRLLELQKKSTSELQTITHEVDLSEPAEYARTSVQGKSLRDALFHLALLPAQPNYPRIRKRVEERIVKHPLLFIFSGMNLDSEGRVAANRPSMLTDDQNAIEGAKLAEIYGEMNREREMRVIGLIEPTRHQILLENNVRPQDIASVIRFSPFVPENHIYQITDGLYYGLTSEFLASAHILIPQIENSVRYVLNHHGVITSTLSSEGIQENMNLNRLLYLQQTREIFGEENVFDMRGLLVEKVGPNLRNEVSHGMMSDGHFFRGREAIYLWWLVLRLCLVPVLISEQAQDGATESSVETVDESGQAGE